MGIEQLYGTSSGPTLEALYTARGRLEPAENGSIPASWGTDTISISVLGREELRKSTMEKPAVPETECFLTINGKKTDIAQSLRDLAGKDPEQWINVMNSLTHGGPEDFAQALSAATGAGVADIKAALQGMNAGEAAEFAIQLGELLGVPPSIFKETLASLTGIHALLLEKQLKAMLGNAYVEAEALKDSYNSQDMPWNNPVPA